MRVPVHEPTTPAARSADVTLDLDAPVETVWQALTDAAELVRWFPTDATVEPREGGRFLVSWEGQWQWQMTITDFEPPHRLRMTDRSARPFDANGQPVDGVAPAALVLEITLEGRGGPTVLHLVHSGFGSGLAWDDELDGVTLGWNVELRGLRHYLAHHRGRPRQTAWAHAVSEQSLDELWSHLTSPAGLMAGWSGSLRTGDWASLRLTTGDTFEGTVIWSFPGRQLVIDAENFGHTLVRLSLDRAAGRSMAQVWLSSWAMPVPEVEVVGRRLQNALTRAMRQLEER